MVVTDEVVVVVAEVVVEVVVEETMAMVPDEMLVYETGTDAESVTVTLAPTVFPKYDAGTLHSHELLVYELPVKSILASGTFVTELNTR